MGVLNMQTFFPLYFLGLLPVSTITTLSLAVAKICLIEVDFGELFKKTEK